MKTLFTHPLAGILATIVGIVAGSACAEPQPHPVGGLGDAWFQDQPSSVGITNGYDPLTQTYLIPGNPPYRIPANPQLQDRAATPRR
jgi:hypothetical protein